MVNYNSKLLPVNGFVKDTVEKISYNQCPSSFSSMYFIQSQVNGVVFVRYYYDLNVLVVAMECFEVFFQTNCHWSGVFSGDRIEIVLCFQCTVGPLLSSHPRDFENWPLKRGTNM